MNEQPPPNTPQTPEPNPSTQLPPATPHHTPSAVHPVHSTSQATGSPPTPQSKSKGPDPDYVPMEETGFSQILNTLLKKPLSVIHEIVHGKKSPLSALFIITLTCLAIFGLVLGIFSSGTQLWAAPVKVIGGVFFSGLICLPSLYIFGALGGMDAKIQHTAGVMLTFLALTSLLMVGFAPVVWLFSTSSDSVPFFGFLSLAIWVLCLIFGLRVVSRTSQSMGGGKGGHLNIWAIIFMLVTIQMTTTLRPIIGKSESFINLDEKRFFLGYWFEIMNEYPHSEESSEEYNQEQPRGGSKPESSEQNSNRSRR